jgi:hypothetical protein
MAASCLMAMISLSDLYTAYFEATSEPDQAAINDVTAEIVRKFQDASTLNEIVAILSSREAPAVMKRLAAVDLLRIIRCHDDLLFSPPGRFAPYLAQFVDVLRGESDPEVVRLLISSLEPQVFAAFAQDWADVVALAADFMASGSTPHVRAGFQIFGGLLPYCAHDFLGAHIDFLLEWIQAGLASDDPPVVTSAMVIFACLVERTDPNFPSFVRDLFATVCECFAQLLVGQFGEAAVARRAVCHILKVGVVFAAPKDIIDALLAVARNSEIPQTMRNLSLYPIRTFLRRHGNSVKEQWSDIARLVFEVSIEQFDEVGYEANKDEQIAIELFEQISASADPSGFLAFIWDLPADTPAASFATLCALIGSVESLGDALDIQIEAIIQYGVQRITPDSLTVAQAVFRLFEAIHARLGPHGHDLMELTVQTDEATDDDELAFCALEFFAALLENVDQEPSDVLSVIPALFGLIDRFRTHPIVAPAVLFALSAAIRSAREEASRIPDDIAPRAWEIAQGHGSSEVIQGAVSVLGRICAFALSKLGDDYMQVVRHILSLADPAADDVELRCRGLRAIKEIVHYQPQLLQADAGTCFLSAIAPLKSEASDDTTCQALDVLRLVMNTYPDSVGAFPGGLPAFHAWGSQRLNRWMKSRDPAIARRAIRTGLQFHELMSSLGCEFAYFDDLLGIIQVGKGPLIVGACFASFCEAVRVNREAADPFFEKFVEFAVLGILRSLTCQLVHVVSEETKFEWCPDICQAIYDFLIDSIANRRTGFPIPEIFAAFERVHQSIRPFEQFVFCRVFAEWIDVGGEFPLELIEFALSRFLECDFTVPPGPVYFVEVLIRHKPEMLTDHIPQIVAFLAERLSEEKPNLVYYWETMTSVIVTIFHAAGHELLDLAEFIPRILGRLPGRGTRACKVYEAIVQVASQNMELFAPHAAALFKVMTQTLGQTDRWFAECGINDEVMAALVQLFRTLVQQVPDAQTVIGDILEGDQIKLEKLAGRVTPPDESFSHWAA